MTTFDDQLLQDAEDDRLCIAFIKNYLPQEVKPLFTDDQLYYFLDLLVDYYATSGVLDQKPDAEGYIDIDIDQIATHLAREAKREGIGEFATDDLRWVVEGEMEYGEQAE